MDNQFPKMLYKAGGAEEIHGGRFSTLIANDEAEQDAALADGWHLSTTAALEKKDAGTASTGTQGVSGGVGQGGTDDNTPPTRAELEQKATELGIKFDKRIGDKKLGDLIAAALEKKD